VSAFSGGNVNGGTWEYQWQNGGTILQAWSGTSSYTASLSSSVTYTVYMRSTACAGNVSSGFNAVYTYVTTPAQPGAISGATPVCAGTTGLVYSISAVPGATSYNWTVPSGASITAGSGTTSITVSMGSNSGNVTVNAQNMCGTSASQTLAVTVNAAPSVPTATGNYRCDPGVVVLTASGAGAGEDYRWYSASTGGTLLFSGTSYTTPFLSATTTYYVVKYQTSSPFCESSPRVAVTAGVFVASGIDTYTVTRNTGITYTNISGTGTAVSSWRNGTSDDNLSNTLNIGFNFLYDGGNHTQFRVSTNGFITFNTATPATGDYLPACGNVNAYSYDNSDFSLPGSSAGRDGTLNAIAPFYNSIGPDAYSLNTSVHYQVTGVSPNRILTVQWRGMSEGVNSSCSPCDYSDRNFQVKLYETTNNIEFVYSTMYEGWDITDDSYTCGINSSSLTGTPTVTMLYNQSANNSAVFNNTPQNSLNVAPTTNSRILLTRVAPAVPTSVPMCVSYNYPLDKSVNQCLNTILSWSASDGVPTGYDVYFGTAASPPLVSSNQGSTYYNPGALSPVTTYYWKIIPRNAFGPAASASVWEFTTGLGDIAPTSISSSAGTTLCVGTTSTISIVGGNLSEGSVFNWTSPFLIDLGCTVNPPYPLLGNCAVTSFNYTFTSTGTYKWYAFTKGCNGKTSCASITITVIANNNSTPTGITSSLGNPICSGSTTTLTATGGTLGTGSTTEWFTGSCGGTLVGTGTSINVSPTVNTTYYVRRTGGTGPCPNTTTCYSITVNVTPGNTITLSSAPATTSQTVCQSSPITNITYSTTVATGATFSGLPAGVTGSWASNTVTISGTPSVSGTYNYTVTLTGGCGTATSSGTIYVNPVNTILLTSAAGTNNQTVCVNSAITNITYSTTGATGATFSGLPPGVTGSWAGNVVTITGSPTSGGVYGYTVTLTGGCGTVTATGSITVNPVNTILLTSAAGTNNQTACISSPITSITYSTTGATGATVSGLPTGVTGSWAGNTVTINGTPTMTGTFNYTVTLTGGCGTVTATGSITVNPANTISLSSAAGTNNQTLCVNNAITPITYATTGATGAGFSGLPSGVNGTWSSNTVTISGTPSASGTFSYTVTLTGGCGNVTATGAITVNPNNTLSLTSAAGTNNQSVCANSPIASITYSTTGATGATFSGLPSGVGGSWASNAVTIGGTPVTAGTYNYTITLTGGCGTVTANGTITVVSVNTIALTSAAGSDNQAVCLNSAVSNISYSTTGATGASFSGLPAGVNGLWAGNIITISGSPSAAGTFNYTITLTGGCGTVTANGSITVNNIPSASASGSGPYCVGQAIQLNSAGGTSYSWSGPAGYTSNSQNPSISSATLVMGGTYTVTVTGTGGCTSTASVAVVVNPNPTVDAGPDQTIPYGTSTFLSGTVSGGSGTYNYSWQPSDSLISATIINPATVNLEATTIFTLTATDASTLCQASDNVTVNVNGGPLSVIASALPTAFCIGGSSQLNATATGGSGTYTYSWASNPVGFSDNTANPIVNPLVTTTYYVTVSDGFNTVNSSVLVTVHSLPTAVASNDGPVCENGTVILNGLGGSTYLWSGPGGFTSTDQSPVITPANLATAGVYNVTVTNDNGCTDVSQTDVIVNALPVVSASNDGPVCVGDTVNLNSAGTGTFEWTGPNGFSFSGQNTSVSGVTSAGSGIYYVILTDANNCTNTDSTEISVNSLPVITVDASSPVCESGTLNLEATGGTGYSWTGPDSFTSGDASPVISNVSLSNAGYYYVTVSDINGCMNNDSILVNVDALPVVVISSNSPVCESGTLNLNASGGNTYSWTGPAGFTSSLQNPSLAAIAITGSGMYYVTVNNACGSTVDSVDVLINAAPVIISSSNSPVCEGETISLSASGGLSYSWSGPGGFSSSIASPDITSATSAMSGNYSVTVTGDYGCTAVASVSVTINSLPVATAISGSPVCEGHALSLTATGGTGYSWSGPDGFSSSISSPVISSVTMAGAGTYTVTVTNAQGCSAVATTAVVVNTIPVATASNNGPLCEGTALLFTSGGGVSYSWSGPGGYSSFDQNPLITSITIAHAGTYTVTVTNAAGCTSTATTTVTIDPAPSVNAFGNSPICEGGTLLLNSLGGGTYSWTGPAGFSSNLQNPQITNVQSVHAGAYVLIVTSANGCTASQTVPIVINTAPAVTCSDNDPACPGDPLMLIASGGNTYNWAGPNGFSSNVQNPVIVSPSGLSSGTYSVTVTTTEGCSGTAQTSVVYPAPISISGVTGMDNSSNTGYINISVSGGALPYDYLWSNGAASEDISGLFAGDYIIVITDAGGCHATDTFTIDIPLIIPNVITPNGDGKNDDFEIVNIGAYEKVTVEIFNRWGTRLFVFSGSGVEYADPARRWNGDNLPMGSYLYVVIINDEETYTGAVMVKY
jgi:gliding motility-associated-like protein